MVAWRHLRHPHILPFIGVNFERHKLAMVSEWMDHGNINDFVKEHEVNRVQLVSNRGTSYGDDRHYSPIQLVDVATGLEYMHSINMVHGDLKGVRPPHLPCARTLLTTTRQISSSTRTRVHVSQTLVFRPSLARGAALEPVPPRPPRIRKLLSYRSLPAGLLGG